MDGLMTQLYEWSVAKSCETGADSGNKGTGKFDSAKWETPRWQHIYPTVQGQANGLGCQCPSTYAESHTGDTAREANAAANQAAANEIAKYDALASMHIFYPVAIETEGTWNHWDVELVQKIGRQATSITGETR